MAKSVRPSTCSEDQGNMRAVSRTAPVKCPVCERSVKRRSRQQRYCSTRCMRQANYVRNAGSGLLLGQATALVRNPPKSSRQINELQWAKTRSSTRIIGPSDVVHAEVFAGRDWEEVVSNSGVVSYVSRIAKRALVGGGTP